MKKGKTSKIQGFKIAKVVYGTVDSFELNSIYLNIQTWVEPKDGVENWSRVVLNLSRSFKHTIPEIKNSLKDITKNVFKDNFYNNKYFSFTLTKKDKNNSTEI